MSKFNLSKHLMRVECDEGINNLKVFYKEKYVETIPLLVWFIYWIILNIFYYLVKC